MTLHVEFYSTLRLDLKIKKLEYEIESELTVEQLIHRLSANVSPMIYSKLIEDSKPIVGTNILINGRNFLHMKGLKTPLHDDDKVQIFPPAAGG